MPAISLTSIHTPESTADDLDLCGGYPMFPALGAAHWEYKKNKTILNKHATILDNDLTAYLNLNLFFGVCGPSWACYVPLEGSHDTTSISVKVPAEDAMLAGFLAGLVLTIHGKLLIDFAWYVDHDDKKIDKKISIDLLEKLVNFIIKQYVTRKVKKKAKQEKKAVPEKVVVPKYNIGGVSMLDAATGTWHKHKGTTEKVAITVDPNFPIQLDMVSMIGGPLGEIAHFLEHELASSLRFGPAFDVGLPTTMTVKEFHIGGTKYDKLKLVDNEIKGTAAGTSNASKTDELVAKVGASTSFDFDAGFFYYIKIWKLWSHTHTYSFSLVKLLGLNTKLSDKDYVLPQGVKLAARETPEQPFRIAEVVLHDPNEAAG